jgi:hypothetical protein
MSDLNMFIPITKVDAQRRLVYGVATAEAEDRAGEICDYASTKPLYQKWSQEIAQSSGGKSRGNLRAMHGNVAAGKVTALNFNDKKKQIEICAKVVDESEWNKVKEGVYTGFSQGGTYARRWTDEDGRARYTAAPSEISLVDLPCLPQARFEMVKTDGSREWRYFVKDAGALAQLAQILGEIEDLKEALAPDADDDQAYADAITQLGSLVGQARGVLETIGADEDQDTTAAETPVAAPDKRAAVFGHDLGGRNAGVAFGKRLDRLDAMLADLLKRVKNIEAQPQPLPLSGAARAVSKGQEADASLEKLLADPDALSLLAIKIAQRNGRSFLTR